MYWLSWIYAAALTLMAVFGFNMLFLSCLALLTRRPRPLGEIPPPQPAGQDSWPMVLVQLPLFNERYVVERVIDAVAALQYPPDRLHIQVLDDSTDDTTNIVRARVAYHVARGRPMTHLHRTDRTGFKAGALGAGLAASESELVAIFDADFVPAPDFLWRTVPQFASDPRLAVVQARWDHMNADLDGLTRAEALALDAYFGVEQSVRSTLGLLMNFNGSAGIWRRAAIEDAGGWQSDTLAEDLDLSYRAQLRGWRLTYLPEVTAPAELPTTIMAFKRQQYRWAKGSFQVLRKIAPRLWTVRMPVFRKLQGFLHLFGYLPHPLMVLSVLLSLPVVLWLHGQTPMRWAILGLASFGPPVVGLLGQLFLRRDWPRRLAYYPLLVLLGLGLALNNTVATGDAFFGKSNDFKRTPKGGRRYALGLDWTTWAEAFLAFYALVSGLLALQLAPGLAYYLLLYALGFGYIAGLGFWQAGPDRESRQRPSRALGTTPVAGD